MSSFESSEDATNVPDYNPPPIKKHDSSDLVQLWMETAYEAWPDLPMEKLVETLSTRLSYSIPRPPLTYDIVNMEWARFSIAEARALAFELHQAGIDMEALLDQITAFPYHDISLAWLIEPERSIFMHATLADQMDEAERQEYPESFARLRHTAEFINRIARLIPQHMRIWLKGWTAAYVHAAFAQAVGLASPE